MQHDQNPLEEYIADHYGICIADVCKCLKTGWMGRNCDNWRPVNAKNWDELIKENGG
jgi:hypothetical protein